MHSETKKKKCVVMACGGTAGHVFPAESLGTRFLKKGWDVAFAVDARGQKFLRLFQQDATRILSKTPSTRRPLRFLWACVCLFAGLMQALALLVRKRPHCVVGFGGYPSFPVLVAAFILRIPIFLQEQNVVIGRVNKLFARPARVMFCPVAKPKGLPETSKVKIVCVPTPLREEFYEPGLPPRSPSLEHGPFHLLVFGGSQGSSLLTKVVPEALKKLSHDERRRLVLVQQCPKDDAPSLTAAFEEWGIRSQCAPFFEGMREKMLASHLIISRSGASSVQEVALLGRAALFVPLSAAIDQDQLENAKRLTDEGAAFLCLEKEFTVDYLTAFLGRCMREPDFLQQAVSFLQKIPKQREPSSAIVEIIEQTLP